MPFEDQPVTSSRAKYENVANKNNHNLTNDGVTLSSITSNMVSLKSVEYLNTNSEFCFGD